MKKILFFAALVLAALQVTAADVDLATAQQSAQRYLMNKTTKGRSMTTAPAIMWTHVERNSSNLTQAAYYIVNTENGYVIVSGDDRAPEVLACGDGPLESMNNIPENMQFFLDMYKAEMEYLQAHPGEVVKAPTTPRGQTVEPLLTTLWQQGSTNGRSPYNKFCPMTNGYYCLVGCAAVSLSQVMNYWKYPAGSPALPEYTGERGVTASALSPITFDWAHMRNSYKNDNWSEAEGNAIANLMRYVGGALFMDYNPDMSGADEDQMLMALRLFGYDAGAHYVLKNDYDEAMTELYSDADWTTMMQTELAEGRPLMYCAYSAMSTGNSFYGHAFNVDGYNASTNMYHVNFGQSEDKNGDYAFNAFGYGITVYKYFQLMFVGMKPTPEGVALPPRIIANKLYNSLGDEGNYVGWDIPVGVHVIGADLTGDITVTLHSEDGLLSTDVTTITREQLNQDEAHHKYLTVNVTPQEVGNFMGYLTLNSPGAEPVDIYFYGEATAAPLEKYDPEMRPANEEAITLTSFRADWTDRTPAELVNSYTLEVSAQPTYNLVAEADWSGVGSSTNNISSNPGLVMTDGWEFNGGGLWQEGGYISINYSSRIMSPTLDLTGCDKVKVVFNGRTAAGSTASLTVSTSKGSKAITMTNTMTEYVVELECNASDRVTFAGTNSYPGFQNIKIYAGQSATGDANYRLIPDITTKSQIVESLTAGGTFDYRVKTLYTDGTWSDWSNIETVTLFGSAHDYEPGDVNHDHAVNISDVILLINHVSINAEVCEICGDLNNDHVVNITDITTLINRIVN
jgi:hypothetical protein